MLKGVSVFDRPSGETNVQLCEEKRQIEAQTLTQLLDPSLTPALSWVPTGGPAYKLTAKSSSAVDMTEDVSQQKKMLSFLSIRLV